MSVHQNTTSCFSIFQLQCMTTHHTILPYHALKCSYKTSQSIFLLALQNLCFVLFFFPVFSRCVDVGLCFCRPFSIAFQCISFFQRRLLLLKVALFFQHASRTGSVCDRGTSLIPVWYMKFSSFILRTRTYSQSA